VGQRPGSAPLAAVKILVNHLTRMQPGFVCVAGLDIDTLEHVRPVLRYGRLTTDLVRPNGGPFDIGSVVDLGEATYVGHAPELEDYRFDPTTAKHLSDRGPDEFWRTLEAVARDDLADVFGPSLELWDDSGTVDVGEGNASLGCLRPEEPPWLYVDHRGTVRLVLHYLLPSVDLSVADLRSYEEDHRTPRQDLVADLDRRMKSGVETILSVGLTRPFRKIGDDAERHWLQVNNIHLRDDPLWRLDRS
jgi:hypothetical protein